MAAPPASTRTSLKQRLSARARERWPPLAGIDVRFRGEFAYVTGRLKNGNTQPLMRLRYGGSAARSGFAVYLALRSTPNLRCMDVEDLRIAVYNHFRQGEVPRVTGLATELSTTQEEVGTGLATLAAGRHVALGPDGEITMAHPFTTVPLGFSVMGRDALWWGGCAWDSFALPHLLPDQGPMLVATTCPACDQAHAWRVDDQEPPVGDQVAHFLVPTARMWDDVVYTCGNQRIFCSEACVSTWLDRSGRQRGSLMDLRTLWRLASGWYAGRLERGYVRREPTASADYLRSVGLSGEFWGLTTE